MKRSLALLLAILTTNIALAALPGRIQNEDVKSLTDIQSSVNTITGNLSTGNACIASPSSTSLLAVGQFIYDTTTPANISSGTTIAGLPGTCSAGQIQMSTTAGNNATGDTITFGGQKSQLINDTKLYVSANSINDTLYNAIANGQIGSSGGAGGIELLANPGFEQGGLTGWTASGGTTGTVTSGSNLIAGKTTASWTATASAQTFSSAAYAIQGLAGGQCSAQLYYLYAGTAGDYTFQVVDGSANVLASTSLATQTLANTPTLLSFPCGGAYNSTLQFQVKSTVSSPGTIYMDTTHLGSLTVQQLSQAQEFGTISITGCSFSTSSGSYVNLTAAGTCAYVVTGQLSAPAGNTDGFTATKMPAGSYWIQQESNFYAVGTNADGRVRFNDGTNFAREVSEQGVVSGGQTSTNIGNGINQSISYTSTQSNITIQLQGEVGTGNVDIAGTPIFIKVMYLPSTNTNTVSVGQQPQSYSADQIGSGWSTSSSTFADPSTGTSISLSNVNNQNFSSVVSNAGNLPGLDVALSTAGQYLVCARTTGSSSGGGTASARLVDGSGTVIDGGFAISPVSASLYSGSLCGIYTAVSSGVKTFKIQIATNIGSTSVSNAVLGTAIHWNIINLTSSLGAAQFNGPGSVTSNGANAYHHEAFNGVCSSSASISSYTTASAVTIGNISSGCCVVTIPAEYSTTPFIISGLNASTSLSTVVESSCSSSTSCTICDSVGGTTTFNFESMLDGH